jgi:hypothetical protein
MTLAPIVLQIGDKVKNPLFFYRGDTTWQESWYAF